MTGYAAYTDMKSHIAKVIINGRIAPKGKKTTQSATLIKTTDIIPKSATKLRFIPRIVKNRAFLMIFFNFISNVNTIKYAYGRANE